MSTQPLYCHSCNKNYNVRQEDLILMQKYDKNFDNSKGYIGGCFFKNLGQIKRSLNARNQMIIDVYASDYDDSFIDNIEEIIEDTMVQMFILHPKSREKLENVQKLSKRYDAIFYAIPYEFFDKADKNCIGVCITKTKELDTIGDFVVMVDESSLDNTLQKALDSHKGIILNASKNYENLKHFFVSIGSDTVEAFDSKLLKNLSMEKIVLQSNYPKQSFDTIEIGVKKISDIIFRSEQSIIAQATKNAIGLFNLKKV